LLSGAAEQGSFQDYARSVLRPSFEEIGWEPKSGEPNRIARLRGSLIEILGELNDEAVVADAQERFQRFVAEPTSLSPDLRISVLRVVGRSADEATWHKLHELGRKTNSIEEKQNYYEALASTIHPKLIEQTLQIALSDELSTSQAANLVPLVARRSGRPDIVWNFAKQHMKPLLAKLDALAVNSYAPGLFVFFSDPARVAELKSYAEANLSPAASKAVDKATDEISNRAGFRKRLADQIASWGATPSRG
jgi:aminopeptidase N